MVVKKRGKSSNSKSSAVKSKNPEIKNNPKIRVKKETKARAGSRSNSHNLRSKATVAPPAVTKRTKVLAKKTTVRAPIQQKAKVTKDNDENEHEHEHEHESEASEESEFSVRIPLVAVKKKGRKKEKKEKKENNSSSSMTKATKSPSKGGRPRAVNKFLGGQRLALIAKESFIAAQNRRGSDTFDGQEGAKTLVIESKSYNPRVSHRKRCPWSEEEVESLTTGVERHGEGSWSAILNDADLCFNLQRTQIDLKDKWRNMKSYIRYSEHPIRRFILLNSKHEPIISPSGNTHIFKNRWPRDAAMKVATRSEFYNYNLPGQPGQDMLDPSRPIMIYLREVMDEADRSCRPPFVHVYRGTRVQEPAKNIAKFKGLTTVWTAVVEKLGEEILISQTDLDHIQTKE